MKPEVQSWKGKNEKYFRKAKTNEKLEKRKVCRWSRLECDRGRLVPLPRALRSTKVGLCLQSGL
jgi:hypothetical protein